MAKQLLSVEITIALPIAKVWEYWTLAEHITKWNFANDDWICPHAENNLQPNGSFCYRMEAKNGSVGFDYKGIYNAVDKYRYISYHIEDGRYVEVNFNSNDSITHVRENFEAEKTTDPELQKNGWQSILESFKKYAESN